jgi:hypothetical protein
LSVCTLCLSFISTTTEPEVSTPSITLSHSLVQNVPQTKIWDNCLSLFTHGSESYTDCCPQGENIYCPCFLIVCSRSIILTLSFMVRGRGCEVIKSLSEVWYGGSLL